MGTPRQWLLNAVAVAASFSSIPNHGRAAQVVQGQGEAMYEGLRDMALHTQPSDVGMSPLPQSTSVYGIVMDLDVGGKTATVVSFSSGDASIYLSNGGGMIGGQSQLPVVEAARKFIAAAQVKVSTMVQTASFPRPGAGRVTFYLLTTKGVFTAEADEDTLARGGQTLSPLFGAGQDVIAALGEASPSER